MPSSWTRSNPARRAAELEIPRVPPLHRARALLWSALALVALRPLWPATRLPEIAVVEGSDGCQLAPRSRAAPCACEALPGGIRVLLGLPVPVNSAGEADLRAVPGIGPVRAAAIVADRVRRGRFHSLDDLDRVRGIGRATVERLRPFLFAAGGDPACAHGPLVPRAHELTGRRSPGPVGTR